MKWQIFFTHAQAQQNFQKIANMNLNIFFMENEEPYFFFTSSGLFNINLHYT